MTRNAFLEQRAAIAAHRFAWKQALEQALDDCLSRIDIIRGMCLANHKLADHAEYSKWLFRELAMKTAIIACLVDCDLANTVQLTIDRNGPQ